MKCYEPSHHKLEAWSVARKFVADVYRCSKSFPVEERFGLSQQLRRAAISIPSNIAEGAARQSRREFLRYAFIARGSLSEVETQLLIAVDLGYMEQSDTIFASWQNLSRLLNGLIQGLSRDCK